MNADFCVVHLDIVDHGAQPCPTERNVSGEYIRPHDLNEGRNLLFRDPGVRPHLRHSSIKGNLRNVPLRLHGGDPVFEGRVARIGDTVLDRLIQPPEPRFPFRQLRTQRGQPIGIVLIARRLPIHQTMQEFSNPLRRQKPVRQPLDHEAIELVHRDGAAHAGILPFLCAGRAGIITIAARLSGAQGHATATTGAGGNAGQKDWSGYDTRRGRLWVTSLECHLDCIEGCRIDNRVNGQHDLLAFGLCRARLRVRLIEAALALIDGVGDELVQRADAPSCPAPGPVASGVEPGRRRLDTHRTRYAIPFPDEPEHQPHSLGLDGIDRQLLLGLRAALFGGDDRIAIGCPRTIPETLTGILLHGPENVLGVFLRLVLIEQGEDLPDHRAGRIVGELLRHADKPHARLLQTAYLELVQEEIAGKAAEGMYDNHIERFATSSRQLQQPLELRPLVIGAGQARVHEFRDNFPAALLAIGHALASLIGNGKVAVGLPSG